MRSSIFSIAVVVASSVLPLGFNACTGIKPGSSSHETIFGNPIAELSLSPFAPLGDRNAIEICLDRVVLHSSDGSNEVSLSDLHTRKLQLSHLGNVFVRATVESGQFSKVELLLSNSCGSGSSFKIENAYGTFSVVEPLTLSFSGNAELGTATSRVDLQIQNFTNALANVSNSDQIRSALQSQSGHFKTSQMGWRSMNLQDAPDERSRHTAIWTGDEMIVWGGTNDDGSMRAGSRYNPSQDKWTEVTETGAPNARHDHSSVWTGQEMVVWGGRSGDTPVNTGARYRPSENTWVSMSNAGAPTARRNVTLLWTGTYVLVWGGFTSDTNNRLNDGARYNPISDSWHPITLTGAPSPREGYSAQWTGTHMLVWGGLGETGNAATAKLYDPTLDQWSDLPISPLPEASGFQSVWTGSQFLAWGGHLPGGQTNRGTIWDSLNQSWSEISTTGAPSPRIRASSVWSGESLLVWGGSQDDSDTVAYSDGYQYFAKQNRWAAIADENQITARWGATAVWTGTEVIIWGGAHPGGFLKTGARFTPRH